MARGSRLRPAFARRGEASNPALARFAWAAAAAVLACAVAGPALADAAIPRDAGGPFSVHVRSFRDIPFRTVVRQQYDYSCGSAAVATLLRYHYDVPVGESDIFSVMWVRGDQNAIRRVGFSMLDMKHYLEAGGLKADGYQMTLDEVEQEHVPVIALIDLGRYRHFVVIKGVSRDSVLVGDPARGLKIYSRPEFERMWNKIVLMVHDSPVKPRFDQADEWRPWANAPLREANPTSTLAAFTRDLYPLFQITAAINKPPLD